MKIFNSRKTLLVQRMITEIRSEWVTKFSEIEIMDWTLGVSRKDR